MLQDKAEVSSQTKYLSGVQTQATEYVSAAPLQRQRNLAASIAAPILQGLPSLQPASDAAPIQGIFPPGFAAALLGQFGKGVVIGAGGEGARQAILHNVDKVVGGAGATLEMAVGEAMQSEELRAEIRRLTDLSGALQAANDFATRHAHILAEKIRALLPEFPSLRGHIDALLASLDQKIKAILKATYLYQGYVYAKQTLEAGREVMSHFAPAAITAALAKLGTNLAMNLLKRTGVIAVKTAITGAAEPVLDAARKSVEEAREALERIKQLRKMIPKNIVSRGGRKVGEMGAKTVGELVAGPTPDLDELEAALQEELRAAEEVLANKAAEETGAEIAKGGSGGHVATALKIAHYGALVYQYGTFAHELAAAETTEEEVNVSMKFAFSLGLPVLAKTGATMATPVIANALPVAMGSAATAFLPVMLTAGTIAAGTYYGGSAINKISKAIAPKLDAQSDTMLAYPIKKTWHLGKLMLSLSAVPLVWGSSFIPRFGASKGTVDESQNTLLRNYYMLIGRSQPGLVPDQLDAHEGVPLELPLFGSSVFHVGLPVAYHALFMNPSGAGLGVLNVGLHSGALRHQRLFGGSLMGNPERVLRLEGPPDQQPEPEAEEVAQEGTPPQFVSPYFAAYVQGLGMYSNVGTYPLLAMLPHLRLLEQMRAEPNPATGGGATVEEIADDLDEISASVPPAPQTVERTPETETMAEALSDFVPSSSLPKLAEKETGTDN